MCADRVCGSGLNPVHGAGIVQELVVLGRLEFLLVMKRAQGVSMNIFVRLFCFSLVLTSVGACGGSDSESDQVVQTEDALSFWGKRKTKRKPKPKTTTKTKTKMGQKARPAAPRCVGPYHVQAPDGRCVWSCGVGTRPDFVTGQCACKEGHVEVGADRFGRRTCELPAPCPEQG